MASAMTIKNGLLVRGNQLVVGNRQDVPWWNGSARPHGLKGSKFSHHKVLFRAGQVMV
jgi:hypothetical protein